MVATTNPILTDADDLSIAEMMAVEWSDAQIKAFFDQYDRSGKLKNRQDYDSWHLNCRPAQRLPVHNDWDTLLCLAGRGSGKTRMAAEAIHLKAKNPNWVMALIGETASEVRDVMIEGPSGLLATAHPSNPCEYQPSKRRVVWLKSGARATTYSGDAPDQLRGPNCHYAWLDELAKFKYPQEVWDNLQMVLRIGKYPQSIITTTPRPIPLIKELVARSKVSDEVIMRTWSTFRNAANLPARYLARMMNRYAGTRLGRQEINAEVLEDTEGALWRLADIDKYRVNYRPDFSLICVGVDPPTSVGGECGIVVMGLHGEELFCLDDMTISGQPEEWADQVVAAYHKYDADMVVPEKNQGGDMVMSTIRASDPSVPVSPVWASRGKRTRAEPVSTYAQRGAIHHVGAFSDLEDELTTWVPGDESPNRLDAYVHAAVHLMEHTQYGSGNKRVGVF